MLEITGGILIAVIALFAVATVLALLYPIFWMTFHAILLLLHTEDKDDIAC